MSNARNVFDARNSPWAAVLVFGIALSTTGCEAEVSEKAGSEARSTGEARTSSLPSSPAEPPFATLGRDLTLDLGNQARLKLARIPAGKFLMGSPETEPARAADETRHEVTISQPFYLGITPVTVDQFAAFVKASGYRTDAEKDGAADGIEIHNGDIEVKTVDGCSWRHPNFDQKGNHPVVQISWNDARAFCDWLANQSGKNVVLPTEAQWECACRAGTQTAYPWGDHPGDDKGWANCSDQRLRKELSKVSAELFFRWDDGFVFTSPVGTFKPNAFGLYDMIGNVWEWCADWYGRYPTDAVTDPTGADAGRFRVMRGGCWSRGPAYARSAFRGRRFPDLRYRGSRGFRVAVVASVR